MLPSNPERLKQLEKENSRLKKLVVDLSMDKIMLQGILSKNVRPADRKEALVYLKKPMRKANDAAVAP